MSTKSSKYYNEELGIHVYYDHRDSKYHMDIGKKSIIIIEGIGEAFQQFSDIKDMKICPHCLCELNWEDFMDGKKE